ncbi:MAG: hypothetical protein U0Y10_16400 [Spirosomataceae bacterium]
MNTLHLSNLEIRFRTAEIIPPPYAHEYLINCQPLDEAFSLSFQLKYLDREELTLEEIAEEGYTEQDDFEWSGGLNRVWKEELLKLFARTESSKRKAKAEENFIEITTLNPEGISQTFSPQNPQEWEYFSQELIQAIYETAKIELPLKLIYLKKLPQKPDIQLEMTILFSDRSIKTTMQVGSSTQSKELNWQTLHPLLKTIYTGEFLAEKATSIAPTKPGRYINVGDGLWYEFGKSLQNPNGNNRFLHEVESKLDDLLD